MAQFQQLMGQFLETQRQVTQAYLLATAHVSPTSDGAAAFDLAALTRSSFASGPRVDQQQQEEASVERGQADHDKSCERAIAPASLDEGVPPEDQEEQLRSRLLEIVGERTGYPIEVLGLDLNLEAELSIDSIKWVEILGAFSRACLRRVRRRSRRHEPTSQCRTLREVLAFAGHAQATQPSSPTVARLSPASQLTGAAENDDKQTPVVPRFLMQVVDAPLDSDVDSAACRGAFIVTEDGRGVASSVAGELRARGATVVVVRMVGDVPGHFADAVVENLGDVPRHGSSFIGFAQSTALSAVSSTCVPSAAVSLRGTHQESTGAVASLTRGFCMPWHGQCPRTCCRGRRRSPSRHDHAWRRLRHRRSPAHQSCDAWRHQRTGERARIGVARCPNARR